MAKDGVDGIVVSDTPEHITYSQVIVDLAARFHVPAIYPLREFVEVGGLMAYGVDSVDLMRRVADMTDQVLGGTKPSDISVLPGDQIRAGAQSKNSNVTRA